MARPYDRPATLAALVNALVVMILPVALATLLMMNARGFSDTSTRVTGVDPDRAAVADRQLRFLGGYLAAVSPFAMAAAWRTFVHAKRWLGDAGNGARGILEAGACGFLGAVFVLLPGILTKPGQAPPYVIVYGGLSAVVGLAIGLVLWTTAAAVLKVYGAYASRAVCPHA